MRVVYRPPYYIVPADLPLWAEDQWYPAQHPAQHHPAQHHAPPPLPSLKRLRQLEKRRQELHAALQHEFAACGGRNRWVWLQAQTRTYRSIGDQIGISPSRVQQVVLTQDRRQKLRAKRATFDWRPVNKG